MMSILSANTDNEVTLVFSSGFSSLMTDTMYRTLSNSITRPAWPLVTLEGGGHRLWPLSTNNDSGSGEEEPEAGPNYHHGGKKEKTLTDHGILAQAVYIIQNKWIT